jgi:hypothetical protein
MEVSMLELSKESLIYKIRWFGVSKILRSEQDSLCRFTQVFLLKLTLMLIASPLFIASGIAIGCIVVVAFIAAICLIALASLILVPFGYRLRGSWEEEDVQDIILFHSKHSEHVFDNIPLRPLTYWLPDPYRVLPGFLILCGLITWGLNSAGETILPQLGTLYMNNIYVRHIVLGIGGTLGLSTLAIGMLRCWKTTKSYELFAAYLNAKKAKVCPTIVFTDSKPPSEDSGSSNTYELQPT